MEPELRIDPQRLLQGPFLHLPQRTKTKPRVFPVWRGFFPLCHRLPAHAHARKGERPALLLLGISLTLRVLQHSMFALLAERAGWGFDKDEQKSLASSSAMYVPQRKHLSKKAKAAAKARCQGEHAVGLASSPSSFALSCSLPPLTGAPLPADDLVQISLHQPARTWTSPA